MKSITAEIPTKFAQWSTSSYYEFYWGWCANSSYVDLILNTNSTRWEVCCNALPKCPVKNAPLHGHLDLHNPYTKFLGPIRVSPVSYWLDGSHLRLNPGETEVMWLGSKFSIDRETVCDIPSLLVLIRVSDSVRILGVIVDSQLSIADHVSSLCRSVYYQLRQL